MHRVDKSWGYYTDLVRWHWLCLKLLVFYPGRTLSVQKHTRRAEFWLGLTTPFWMAVWPGEWHTYANVRSRRVHILELQLGLPSEEDIERK